MKLVFALRSVQLLDDDGRIHFTFSKFLNDNFSNPHTQALAAQWLRILYRFCNANRIELAVRALDGRCLSYTEVKSLSELCYRPLPEIEAMGDRKVVFLTSPKAGKAPKDLPGAVQDNTAQKRLNGIAAYLVFCQEVIFDPSILSSSVRDQLKSEYEKTSRQLKTTIKGTKQNHHLSIKSLPAEKYFAIIRAAFVRPKEIFLTELGKPSLNLMRDRAMVLLSCEGLRPGTLGNIQLADIRPASGHLVIKDNRAKRGARVTTNTLVLKMGNSTQVNNASETIIKLWPFTIQAIQDYINGERAAVLMKRLTNRSNGFLFLSDEGQPIKHRSSITEMFNKLGKRLAQQGLLDIGDDPYFSEKITYDFYGYVLRHSAASFFLAHKCTEIAREQGTERPGQYKDVPDRVKDLMKLRFGWTVASEMPSRYAARALADNANILLMDFNQSLLDEVQDIKNKRECVNDV
jgi:integrase